MNTDKNMSTGKISPETLAQLHEAFAAPTRQQRDFARPLGFALLESMRGNTRYMQTLRFANETQMSVVDFGREMIEAMWPQTPPSAGTNPMNAVRAHIESLTDEGERKTCAELLAKLGHLYQIAGLMQRKQVLDEAPTEKTITAFLRGDLGKNRIRPFTHAADAVKALITPKMELTFTAHPTNTNGKSGMIAQREIGLVLNRWRTDPSAPNDLALAIQHYANAPLLPERTVGQPKLSVRDEIDQMLYFMNNTYYDIDAIYHTYDQAIVQHQQTLPGDAPYRPETLRLNIGFHSWGSSGDKDGNKNVNADTTLYGLACHYHTALANYEQELSGISGLRNWHERIYHAREIADKVKRMLEVPLDDTGHVDEQTHDALKAELRSAVGSLHKKEFVAALQQYYVAEPPEKDAVLALLRHADMFGFSMGKLEYRETAIEFERILADAMPEYGEIIKPMFVKYREIAERKKERDGVDEQQTGRRAQLMREINAIEDEIETLRENIEPQRRHVLETALNDPSRYADIYQALIRNSNGKELAAYSDNDAGAITYQTRKRLELARDFPAAFENHVLAECQDTSNLLEMLLMQKSVSTPQRQLHMGIVPLFEDGDTLLKSPKILGDTLKIPAYRQHLNDIAGEYGGIVRQQIQLAHSDNSRRNGLPAARALIFRTHETLRDAIARHNRDHKDAPVALEFYEGGSVCDPYRGGGRAVSASINEYESWAQYKTTVQGGDLLALFNNPHSIYRFFNRNVTHSAARLISNDENPERQTRANDIQYKLTDALIATRDDYIELFRSGNLNQLYQALDFPEEAAAGNVSSRAGSRSNTGSVDVTGMRTIPFVEVPQHAGLNPAWIGILTLPDHLKEQGLAIDARSLHKYYTESTVFRDVIDHVLWALTPARNDMEYVQKRAGNNAMFERLSHEEAIAFELALSAYTGKSPSRHVPSPSLKGQTSFVDQLATPEGRRQLLVEAVYPHMSDLFDDQMRYTDLVRSAKSACKTGAEESSGDRMVRMLCHNAQDTHLHGYESRISDPTFVRLFCQRFKVDRPYAPQNSPSRSLIGMS